MERKITSSVGDETLFKLKQKGEAKPALEIEGERAFETKQLVCAKILT